MDGRSEEAQSAYDKAYEGTIMCQIHDSFGPSTTLMLLMTGKYEALVFEGMILGLRHPEWTEKAIAELDAINPLIVKECEDAADLFTSLTTKGDSHGNA